MSESTSGTHHTIWTRLKAGFSGQVSSVALEAYRRAGVSTYDMMERVQQHRDTLVASGTNPWSAEISTQYEFAFAWNAFVLQTLGDKFMDTSYAANPSMEGFLPSVTAEQVMAFYSQVESWVSRANQASSTKSYQSDVHLPASLPQWAEANPCPGEHFVAMLAAAKIIKVRVDMAMADFVKENPTTEHQAAMSTLHRLQADADTAADYAEQLWSNNPPQSLHEQIEAQIQHGLETYYLIGQILAMPNLASSSVGPPAVMATLPDSSSSFNEWCLTDPHSIDKWRSDRVARAAIKNLWANDPDRNATLAIAAEINRALEQGDIVYATTKDGRIRGNYFCCPWAPIYEARKTVSIGGRSINQFETFTYNVSADEIPEGGAFKRYILVTSFDSTMDVDYGTPQS